MPRVFIVEDDPDDRAFLESAINDHPQLELAGWAQTCTEALGELDETRVDAVILDLVLADGSGLTVLERTRELGIPTLVMTVLSDAQSAAEVLASGAAGYLLKDSDARSITESVVQMLSGEAPLNPRIARYLLDLLPEPPANRQDEVPDLTKRELRVLELLARGYTDKQCAAELSRSVHTVATHIKNIYGKLMVHSRAQAISRAVAFRLLEPASLEVDHSDDSAA